MFWLNKLVFVLELDDKTLWTCLDFDFVITSSWIPEHVEKNFYKVRMSEKQILIIRVQISTNHISGLRGWWIICYNGFSFENQQLPGEARITSTLDWISSLWASNLRKGASSWENLDSIEENLPFLIEENFCLAANCNLIWIVR